MVMIALWMAGALLFAGCGENSNVPLAGDIKTVSVEANATQLYATQQVRMTATAHYTDGIADRNVTEYMQWSESNASIAIVDAVGVVSGGRYGGDVGIDGSYQQFGNSVTLHVVALGTAKITAPDTNLTQERTLHLRAEGTFEDGTVLDVTNSMYWVLGAGDSNATIDQNGSLYTGNANGTIEVNASRYDINATLKLTVHP
jgi:hypothetical protein